MKVMKKGHNHRLIGIINSSLSIPGFVLQNSRKFWFKKREAHEFGPWAPN